MENVIIKCLLENNDYFKKIINFVKIEYFKEYQERDILKIVIDYYKKYQKRPSYDVVQMEINDIKNKSPEDIDKLIEMAQDIENFSLEHKEDTKYLIDKTEEYVKDNAMQNALLNSIQIMSGEEKKLDKTHIPNLLKNALALSVQKSLGHNYFKDWKERYDFYSTTTERIETDIDVINKMLRGGFPKKSLNTILSTINIGKTLILSHFATCFLLQGLNVLYVTLEISDLRINERIDQNMFDLKNEELISLDEDKFKKKLFTIKEKTKGNLITLEFPAANININDIGHVMEELEIKEDFTADVLMIDYLTLLRSVTFSKFDTLYSFGKNIAEEVRGFATIHNIPIIAPIQTNRSGFGKTDLDMSDVADSFAIQMTADWSCAVMQTEQLEEEGKYLFKLIKTRYSPKNAEGKRAFVGVDVEKQKLYNLDNPYQGLTEYMKNKGKGKKSDNKSEDNKPKFNKSEEKKYDFKKFKTE